MPNVHINFELEKIELFTFPVIDEESGKFTDIGRRINIKGAPIYSTTYYSNGHGIDFNSDGDKLPLPIVSSAIIYDNKADNNGNGMLYFVESFSDDELGVYEPDQFEATIYYASEQFDEIWLLINNHEIDQMNVSLCIDAPESDISGHEAIINVKKSNKWILEDFVVSRKLVRVNNCKENHLPDDGNYILEDNDESPITNTNIANDYLSNRIAVLLRDIRIGIIVLIIISIINFIF